MAGLDFSSFEKFEGNKPQETAAASTEQTPVAGTGTETQAAPPAASTEQAATGTETNTAAATGTNADEFIETFNKRFSSQYKTDEEIKNLLGLPTRVQEFEGKLKDYESVKKSAEQYKVDLENTQRAEAAKYLESPLMRKAYVADQLVSKYPKADIGTLTELAMSDLTGMEDIEVLTKEQKLRLPSMKIDAIRTAILSEVGIDPTTDPKEWDDVAKVKLAMRAAGARENISKMVDGIQLPQVETKEQRDLRIANERSKRTELLAPHKSKFSTFDKYKMADLDYTVPEEFKSKLGGMFDAFFEAGVEPTEANMEIVNDIRDAVFFKAHEKEIYDVMKKDAESKVRAEYDKKFANTNPVNTATSGDQAQKTATEDNGTSFSMQGQRANRI